MNKLFLLTLALAGFSLVAQGQTQEVGLDAEQTKVRINEIKRDSTYLYGEATMSTREEADQLAKENLIINIEEWCSMQPDFESEQIMAQNIVQRGYPSMSVMRGQMYRSFAYVKKSDLLPSNASITVDSVTAEPAAAVEVAPVEEVPAPSLTPDEQAALAELNISEGAAQAIAEATAPAPVVEPAPTPIVEPTPVPVAEPAPVVEPTPVPVVADEPAPAAGFPMDELVALKDIESVKNFLNAHSDACAHGALQTDPSKIDPMINDAILIIYHANSGQIRTIIDKRQPNGKRVNYFSRYEDKIGNYAKQGCRAWWVYISK